MLWNLPIIPLIIPITPLKLRKKSLTSSNPDGIRRCKNRLHAGSSIDRLILRSRFRERLGKAIGMAETREVMDMREASQYLGVSRETLYKYVYEDRIPAFKLGNRWKFKKTVLDRWMEKQSAQHEEHIRHKARGGGR